MKEIIEQIARIDAVAFENEQKNKSILLNEKQRLENEMKKYRDEKLEVANHNAKVIYNQIVSQARNEFQAQEEKVGKITRQIEENYMKAEKDVLKAIFEKLFTV